ncbi:hypothetical protein [Streptomyces sp. NPDC008122]|uniref:hypothetical protein n=1 Tax=Streptomyces sp. NPDC008122 TaxID=3364810 RepID=UPI0036E15A87
MVEPEDDAVLHGAHTLVQVGDGLLGGGEADFAFLPVGCDAEAGAAVAVCAGVEPVLDGVGGPFEGFGADELAASLLVGLVCPKLYGLCDGRVRGACAVDQVDPEIGYGLLQVTAGYLPEGVLASPFGLRSVGRLVLAVCGQVQCGASLVGVSGPFHPVLDVERGTLAGQFFVLREEFLLCSFGRPKPASGFRALQLEQPLLNQ